MTPNQEQMTKLITDYFIFVNALEKKQSGICDFFYKSKYLMRHKQIERQLEQLYKENKAMEFGIKFMDYRNGWLLANNGYLKEKK